MREITYLEAVREAMTQEMERDEQVFLIGQDIGVYGGAFGATFGMLDKFGPERILETPSDRSIVVHYASGYRSSIAASLLEQLGVGNVAEMVGGIAAWKAANLLLVT